MRLKLIENHSQGHGKKQALIAVNINELALLQGMAQQVAVSLPKLGPTARLQQVAKQLSGQMKAAIAELEATGIDDRTKNLYPYDERSVL